MSLIQIRANTKATPEAVFAACQSLEARNPDNPSFRNEEVLAITGGGMSVVSRLVKVYRDNKAVVDSCSELDAATAISLVEGLNALLKAHTAKTKEALRTAESTMIQTIAELVEMNEAISQELEAAQERIARDQEAHSLLRTDYEKTVKALDSRHQELEVCNDRIVELTSKIDAQTLAYEEKTALLSQRHAETLANALEAQRRTLEKEKNEALMKINSESNVKLDAALLDKNLAEKKLFELQQSLQELKAERATEQKDFSDMISALEITIEEKNEQISEAKALYRQLIAAFKREQETNTEAVTDNLSSVNRSAVNLNSQLERLSESINKILDGK